jgi:hypothetical protein
MFVCSGVAIVLSELVNQTATCAMHLNPIESGLQSVSCCLRVVLDKPLYLLFSPLPGWRVIRVERVGIGADNIESFQPGYLGQCDTSQSPQLEK